MLDIKRMRMISIVWGIILFSLVALLTGLGFYYKAQVKEYKDFENYLVLKTKDYVLENQYHIETKTKISLQELLENHYVEDNQVRGKTCDGYVVIDFQNETYTYQPFVKCANYKTKGYTD